MGWEYHNRRRKAEGQFIDTGNKEQIHVRCSQMEKEQIRGRAYAMGLDISEYMRIKALSGIREIMYLPGIQKCVSSARRASVPDVKGCIFDAARETLDVPPDR